MTIALDYTSPIAPSALHDAGVSEVFRYLAPSGLSKVIHAIEYRSYVDNGIVVHLNWEDFATDWLGGAVMGAEHGRQAVTQAHALGYAGHNACIIGSCDFDIQLDEWNSVAHGYAVAFASAVHSGGYLAGVYGPWDALTWCQDIMDVFWQASMSRSWSQGRNGVRHAAANWRQIGTRTVGGVQADFSEILKPIGGTVTSNIEREMDAVENVRETVSLDIGGGVMHDFPVPFTKRIDGIEAKIDAVASVLSAVHDLLSGQKPSLVTGDLPVAGVLHVTSQQ